jgi:hypothetical protein
LDVGRTSWSIELELHLCVPSLLHDCPVHQRGNLDAIAPFIHFSERYSDITELKAKTGNLKVRFKDGKAMSLWSGLGNFNEFASILMEKTDVLPS